MSQIHPDSVSARLRLLREALGYKPMSFADFLGIARTAWSNYETAFRRPSLEHAFLIKMRTGVPIDWIYAGDEMGLPKHIADKISHARLTLERTTS